MTMDMRTPHHRHSKFRPFYSTALKLGVPVLITNLIGILLNMMDTLMIGKLGISQLAGVGAANRVFFVFMVVCWGLSSGTSVHLAQYWGAGDMPNIRRILGVNYTFCIGFSLLVMASVLLWAPQIVGLFSKGQEVIGYGSDYLRIVQLSYIFCSLSSAASFLSRSVHKLLWPVIFSALAWITNTVLNYGLIYGKLGLPALGVEGAAIATVIARVVEFVAIMTYIYISRRHPFAAKMRELFDWSGTLLKKVLFTAGPALISETTWSVGQLVFFVAYGKLGDAALAVVQVCGNANDLFTAIFFGIGSACAVMIGNELGKGHKDIAYGYAKKFLWITITGCLLMSGLFYASLDLIIRIYGYDQATNITMYRTLLVYVLYATPRMLVYTMFIGILRAGGDTTFCMILDVAGIWCLGVPLAFIAALVWGWPLEYVVAISLVDEVFKLVLCLWRIRSRKWINVLVDIPPEQLT